MEPEQYTKFTKGKRILKAFKGANRTPLKNLLNLPRRLKDKIVHKSSSFWKFPIRNMDRKRKFNEIQENDIIEKRFKHGSESVEYKEIQMAVIHTNYPDAELSIDQNNLIQSNIEESVKRAPNFFKQDLNFVSMEFIQGILWVTCGNHKSVNWLWETVHSLGDTDGEPLLRVVEPQFVPSMSQKFNYDIDYFNIEDLIKF